MSKKRKGLEGGDDSDALVEAGELLNVFKTAWESLLVKGQMECGLHNDEEDTGASKGRGRR